VGNLPNNVVEDDLIELFKSVGSIRKVKIGFESSSDQLKVYAVVTFHEEVDQGTVLDKTHNVNILDQRILIIPAVYKGLLMNRLVVSVAELMDKDENTSLLDATDFLCQLAESMPDIDQITKSQLLRIIRQATKSQDLKVIDVQERIIKYLENQGSKGKKP
jgi:RNA recognition motif-containing protein